MFGYVQVVWRPVFWGLLLQFVFALLVLRTSWGRAAFTWLADLMTDYMDFTDSGSKFAFGKNYHEHFFAFRVRSKYRTDVLCSLPVDMDLCASYSLSSLEI